MFNRTAPELPQADMSSKFSLGFGFGHLEVEALGGEHVGLSHASRWWRRMPINTLSPLLLFAPCFFSLSSLPLLLPVVSSCLHLYLRIKHTSQYRFLSSIQVL